MTTKTREITNIDDLIDSRDVIARIEELRDEIEAADIPANEIGGPNDSMEEEREELAKLEAFAEEAEGYAADWKYGETLIRESYFEDYARELAEDIGAIPSDAQWPCTCIDWEQAARELRMDYSSVEFDGVTYYTQSHLTQGRHHESNLPCSRIRRRGRHLRARVR